MGKLFVLTVTAFVTSTALAGGLDCSKVQTIQEYDRAHSLKIAQMVCSKTPEQLQSCVQGIMMALEAEVIACDSRRLAQGS